MSESNVELVRRVMDAFGRRDFPAMRELTQPDVEFDWSRRLLDGEVIRGHAALRAFIDDTLGIFEEVIFTEEEVIDLGGDQVLVMSSGMFRGRTSGAEVRARAANLWTIRDGKVARFTFYQSKEDALADVAATSPAEPT